MHETEQYIRERARKMRHASTISERRLWRTLRDRRFENHEFRRQYPVGPYVLNFYSEELKLAIEIDGAQHGDARVAEMDTTRTLVLRGYGIEVVRLTNRLMARDPITVGETIRWAIERALARKNGANGTPLTRRA